MRKYFWSFLGGLWFCVFLCFGYVFGLDNSSPEISSGNGTMVAAQASEGDDCTHTTELEMLWTAMEDVPLTPSTPYQWHLILRYRPGLHADDELPVITWKLYRDGAHVDTHQGTFTSKPIPFSSDSQAGRYTVITETKYGTATYESYLYSKFASITCEDPHVVSRGSGSNGQTIETVSLAPDDDGVTILTADNSPEGTPWGNYTPAWSHSSLSANQFEYIGGIGGNRAAGMKIFNDKLTQGTTYTISASSVLDTRAIKVKKENPRVDSITANGNGKTKTVNIDSSSSLSNDNAFYILQGNSFTMTANPWPANHSFPANNPVWTGIMPSLVEGATSVQLPRTATITVRSTASPNTYNVSANYNGLRYMRVIITDQLVKSISGGDKTSSLDPDEAITESETIYLPQGTPLTLTAAPDPINSTFPSGKPTWTADGLTGYLSATTGTSITISDQAPAGTYLVKASHNNTKVIKVVIADVELESLTVANATQENVKGENNWAAVKKSGEYVIVTAKFNPDIPLDILPSGFTWTGGEAVPGKPIQRRVAKETSAQTTVEASLGQISKEVDIWIIWSTIEIQTEGIKPYEAEKLKFFINDPFCGPQEKMTDAGKMGMGNMCGIVTLLPEGIGDIIEKEWDIKRDRMRRIKVDNQPSDTWWELDWVDDDTENTDEILKPVDDKLYVIDGPNIGYWGGDMITTEVFYNFFEWLEWDGEICSEKAAWHYYAMWLKGLTFEQDTIRNPDVDTGHLILPEN